VVGERKEVEELQLGHAIAVAHEKAGVSRPGCGIATEHEYPLWFPAGEIVAESPAHPAAWGIGDHQGVVRQILRLAEKFLGGAAGGDLRFREVAGGRPGRHPIWFNQSQLTFPGGSCGGGEKTNPCVEVEYGRRILARELGDALEEIAEKVAIALKEGPDRDHERYRQLELDLLAAPTGSSLPGPKQSVKTRDHRGCIFLGRNP
jgi:hypothetical protein